ncbi:hypothetical protein DPEC_G00360020 [Dallia pectoralis]|uniref:Uncharacterized protein n=1 Tax=Dallia pectoralis TaxID=75939 RepID=A0ACC2F0S9_DALPE|nr:hypothetical protein DPEC_G00360020 [Dallia pectoralis]
MCAVWHCTFFFLKRPLPSRNIIAVNGCNWPATMFTCLAHRPNAWTLHSASLCRHFPSLRRRHLCVRHETAGIT